ncbi:uncharacterized protein LOC129106767 [Anoplopoma fimbria]|uniref:uncharacterized protein LOC129106767 n=1 Tax=Anoplopoma fimbria TaxID=229290 RepID=UPI0023EC7D37|nr:uncharacterized protein LOC129106767 [Anoplopoma fimbria]
MVEFRWIPIYFLLLQIKVTEHKDTDEVTLNCSVSTYEGCKHTVKWLLQGQDVDKDNKDLKTSTSVCSSNVSFRTSHLVYTSKNYELLKCKVTHDRFTREEHLFTFSPPRSSVNTTGWWLYIVVAVGLAALLIIVVVVARWIITRANRTQGDTIGLTSNPEVNQSAPEDRQHTADPEDGVSYASISHTENSKAQVRGGDAVTYSTVKLPSADAYSLYANVNKPQI